MQSDEEKDDELEQNREDEDERERSNSFSVNFLEEEERRAFCDAFATEIGEDFLKRGISFRELFDVIICAGRDVSVDQLQCLWPLDPNNEKDLMSKWIYLHLIYCLFLGEEIAFEKAYNIFQQIPQIDYDQLYNSFAAITTIDGDVDYDRIIRHINSDSQVSLFKKLNTKKINF